MVCEAPGARMCRPVGTEVRALCGIVQQIGGGKDDTFALGVDREASGCMNRYGFNVRCIDRIEDGVNRLCRTKRAATVAIAVVHVGILGGEGELICAGRAAIVKLLPLSLAELDSDAQSDTNSLLFNGFYPAIWGKGRDAAAVYDSYFTTYIQRDVQQIINVQNLRKFRDFVRLCATRIGQEFVVSTVADELAIDMRTVNSWLSILEASYTVFMLQPYHRNMGKRLVKTPKLYFYDVGLVCYLLGLHSADDVQNSFMRGALFENMVVANMMKNRFNQGVSNVNLYFYRDKSQKEVDVVEELTFPAIQLFEIKSATAFKADFTKNMDYVRKIYGDAVQRSTLIYDGPDELQSSDHSVCNFRHAF